jgi:hypothetical protein
MLVSEMTAHDLFGLIMLAICLFFLAAMIVRNWPETHSGPYYTFVKYAGAAVITVIPAIYFGYGALTAG